jgi:hypothetical protein
MLYFQAEEVDENTMDWKPTCRCVCNYTIPLSPLSAVHSSSTRRSCACRDGVEESCTTAASSGGRCSSNFAYNARPCYRSRPQRRGIDTACSSIAAEP